VRLHGRAQAAEQTPLSALRLGELMQEAGLPAGVVNIVTGFGDAGAALAAHDDVDKVAFTGSTEVGKLIVQAAAGNLKKVSLELGGKSPNVVYSDADLDGAIAGAASGIFFNHGQCCNAGSRLYVQKGIFDEVVSGVADVATSIKVGPGTDADAQMGPSSCGSIVPATATSRRVQARWARCSFSAARAARAASSPGRPTRAASIACSERRRARPPSVPSGTSLRAGVAVFDAFARLALAARTVSRRSPASRQTP
jgi:hypothetical protein